MRASRMLASCLAILALSATPPAGAQKKYDTGASDTEIKIGQTMPYSGPASAYGTIGRTEAAYFRMINEQGGINGRKLKLVSLDDGYSPPKTVEQTRRLVEQERILLVFQSLGTAGNTAVQRYLNTRSVPQLFVATGATKFGDPRNYPWTMGWQPSYRAEAMVYAKYIMQAKPAAKIAVLWMKKYYPQGDLVDNLNVYGYSVAQTLVHVLKQCGDELTRENTSCGRQPA